MVLAACAGRKKGFQQAIRPHGRAGRQGKAGQGGSPGQGRARAGRAGQGRAGQGRAGQGRAGQGRAQEEGCRDRILLNPKAKHSHP